MAFAFDTLGYSKRLREAGVIEQHAEAHAEAARDFIMTELVTKTDLYAVKSDLQAAIDRSVLQTTIRLGSIVAIGIGILAALQRIH